MNQAIKYLEDTDQMSIAFDSFIGRLEQEKVLFSIGGLPSDREKLYCDLFTGSLMDAAMASNKVYTEHILMSLVVDLVDLISEEPRARPLKIALHLSNHKVLVWVEIPDEQEDIIDSFYRIEAKINFKYRQSGFSLSTTVVEESDGLSIPSQYKELTV
jgi:hypothetical protein